MSPRGGFDVDGPLDGSADIPHLNRITTEWNLVFLAHQGTPGQITDAQKQLMSRYAGAVHRYLLAIVRDPDTAAELNQEFALRFLRGDFHRADPARGRFRDFLKRALRNLMIDYHRRQQRAPLSLDTQSDSAPVSEPPNLDAQFLSSWRKEILDRAWKELEQYQIKTRRPYYAVLRLRADHPDLHSPELAEKLSTQLGKPIGAGWVRQNLHLARQLFAEYVLDEVAGSLTDPNSENVEEELGDLKLLDHCRAVLERRFGSP